jgi:hypothetical protein
MDLVKKGSETAKGGFANEREVAKKFNNWKNDVEAKKWLTLMNYNLERISAVQAAVISGQKTDVQVRITIDSQNKTENLSLKRTKDKANFNQIDKRWVDNYRSLWNFSDNVAEGLKLFTGQVTPDFRTQDKRRALINELPEEFQKAIMDFLKESKDQIISDILKGRGEYAVKWMLVTKYDDITNETTWSLKHIDTVLKYYGEGEVRISPRRSVYIIGRITLQRKGGDGGRETSKMLQFKMKPRDIFNL